MIIYFLINIKNEVKSNKKNNELYQKNINELSD